MDAEFLRQLLCDWLSTLPEDSRDKILNLDGKCLRGTQKGATQNPHLHLDSIFSAEEREIYVTEDIDWLPQKEEWQDLKSIILVKSERQVAGQAPTLERSLLYLKPSR